MNEPQASQPAPDARLAGSLMNVVQQLQKNRFGGIRTTQGAPVGAESKDSSLFNTLLNKKTDEQEQNAAPAPGALQEEGSEEARRQRNVGQRKTQSSPGQGPQVQGAAF